MRRGQKQWRRGLPRRLSWRPALRLRLFVKTSFASQRRLRWRPALRGRLFGKISYASHRAHHDRLAKKIVLDKLSSALLASNDALAASNASISTNQEGLKLRQELAKALAASHEEGQRLSNALEARQAGEIPKEQELRDALEASQRRGDVLAATHLEATQRANAQRREQEILRDDIQKTQFAHQVLLNFCIVYLFVSARFSFVLLPPSPLVLPFLPFALVSSRIFVFGPGVGCCGLPFVPSRSLVLSIIRQPHFPLWSWCEALWVPFRPLEQPCAQLGRTIFLFGPGVGRPGFPFVPSSSLVPN